MYTKIFPTLLIFMNVWGCTPCGGPARIEFIPENILVEGSPPDRIVSLTDFGILLTLNINHNSALARPTFIPLMSIAYACTAPQVISKHKVQKVNITSSSNFNDDLPAGSDLSHIFTVSVSESPTVKEYFATRPQIPNQMHFDLTESPKLKQHNFTVRLTFVDGSAYESSTGIINFE